MATTNSDYILFIQGPILSSGRTGKTFFNNKELSESSIVNYHSEDNIIKLINNFGHLFKEIFVITWEGELYNESNFKKNKNCKVLNIQNIAPSLKVGNKKLPTDFNNKFKQFYGLLKGVEQIKNDTAKYILKIRTDQYLQIDKLIEEHQVSIAENENNLKKIFIPYINKVNYLPSDFYILATKQVFTEFVSSMLWNNYIEFNSSVHIDMSLKYAYLFHRKELAIPSKTYFINSFSKNSNRDKIKLQNYLSRNVYKLFSFKIFKNTVWRGDMIEADDNTLKDLAFSDRNSVLIVDESLHGEPHFLDFLYVNIPTYITVKFPIIRGTFIEVVIKKLYRILEKVKKGLLKF